MIMIVVLIVVGITLIVSSIIEWNKDIKRIKELENRLNDCYIQREERILKSMRNNINHRNTNRNKAERYVNKSNKIV